MRQTDLILKLTEELRILLNLSDILQEDYERISGHLKATDLYKDSVRQVAQGDGRI
ncbi:MAG TPA: hypothetical protein VF411_02205 [Bacteroidia bacterium]